MLILGYSGLNNAQNYRKSHIAGITEAENRLSQGMDAAAVLLENGKIIAAIEEERFNREKHTYNFPINSINYCLKKANATFSDIKYICHGFNFSELKSWFEVTPFSKDNYNQILSPETQISLFKQNFAINVDNQFIPVRHHTAHAASSYYPSQFKEALVIVADGIGEIDSISVYHGRGTELKSLQHYNNYSSIGIFYSLIANHLGFAINSGEYKVMGLAPYGDAARYQSFFEECIQLKEKGEIFIPVFSKNKTLIDKLTYRALREWITTKTFQPRLSKQDITQEHKDLAAGLQARLNLAMLHVASYWQQQTNTNSLCLAGGVALNCVSNSILFQSKLFDSIYVQPASGDAGTALGAALYASCCLNHILFDASNNQLPFYGPNYLNSEIAKTLEKYSDEIEFTHLQNEALYYQAANKIAQGKIIGWVQGQMEFGPRALGNRSILADPRLSDMKNRVNLNVKKRESFRPFAPSVKKEKVSTYFEVPDNTDLPHMLFTVNVKQPYRNVLPAVTHVDGSARVQTVDKEKHPCYWQLIDNFEKITGIPIVLNTSFNIKNQPIVCSPEDAIVTFLSTEMDALFIEGFYIWKK